MARISSISRDSRVALVTLALVLQPIRVAQARAPMQPPSPMEEGATLCLLEPLSEKVAFSVIDPSGPMRSPDGYSLLYPAVDVLTFLAGVLTHAAIQSSVNAERKREHQEELDATLAPYRPVLDTYATADLQRRVVERMPAPVPETCGPATPGAWTVRMAGVFLFTPDQRNLVYDARVEMRPPGAAPDTPARVATVRVVSDHLDVEDPSTVWLADGGELLLRSTADLASSALDVGLRYVGRATADATQSWKTHRYMLGGQEQMERAEQVSSGCGRVLLRTLRGAYLDVPVPAEGCDPAASVDGTVSSRPPSATAPLVGSALSR